MIAFLSNSNNIHKNSNGRTNSSYQLSVNREQMIRRTFSKLMTIRSIDKSILTEDLKQFPEVIMMISDRNRRTLLHEWASQFQHKNIASMIEFIKSDSCEKQHVRFLNSIMRDTSYGSIEMRDASVFRPLPIHLITMSSALEKEGILVHLTYNALDKLDKCIQKKIKEHLTEGAKIDDVIPLWKVTDTNAMSLMIYAKTFGKQHLFSFLNKMDNRPSAQSFHDVSTSFLLKKSIEESSENNSNDETFLAQKRKVMEEITIEYLNKRR